MFDKAKNALMAWEAWGRLKEAKVKGKLYATGLALVGAVATAVVAKFTTACPDLVANLGAIATAAVMGSWTYLQTKGEQPGHSVVLGLGGAGLAAATVQIKLLCGPDFFTVLPTIATAGVWVGLMAWLKAPQA
jgi:hypothetical protein